MSTTITGDATTYPTSLTIPSGGDNRNVASVNTPLQGLANRTAWLNAHRVVCVDATYYDNPGGTWNSFSSDAYGVFGTGYIDVYDTEEDDIILIDLSCQAMLGTIAIGGDLRLVAYDGYTGAQPAVAIHGARHRFDNILIDAVAVPIQSHVSIAALWNVATAGTTRIAIQGRIDTPSGGAGNVLALMEAASLRITHTRGI